MASFENYCSLMNQMYYRQHRLKLSSNFEVIQNYIIKPLNQSTTHHQTNQQSTIKRALISFTINSIISCIQYSLDTIKFFYLQQLHSLRMDVNEDPRCTVFNFATHTIVCTLVQDLLKLRVQKTIHNIQQVYILSISSDMFPDYLRHTPYDTPFKLYKFIQARKSQCIKFSEAKISFRINEDEIIEIPCDKYMKVKEDFPSSIKSSQIAWDANTIHAKEYLVVRHILEKLSAGWTQITGMTNISLQKSTKFRARYLKYGGPFSIGIGLITKSRKNCHYSGDIQHEESIGFWSRRGYKRGCICSNGQKIVDWDYLLFNNEGDIMQMTFNPAKMEIIWDNGHKIIDVQLQENFRNKQLYFFVVMHDAGSRIEFLQ